MAIKTGKCCKYFMRFEKKSKNLSGGNEKRSSAAMSLESVPDFEESWYTTTPQIEFRAKVAYTLTFGSFSKQ